MVFNVEAMYYSYLFITLIGVAGNTKIYPLKSFHCELGYVSKYFCYFFL